MGSKYVSRGQWWIDTSKTYRLRSEFIEKNEKKNCETNEINTPCALATLDVRIVYDNHHHHYHHQYLTIKEQIT